MDHFFSTLIQPLLQYIHEHPHWAFVITCVVAYAESLPAIGTIIPGSLTMTAIGTLVGAGILPGISTFFWAVLGAFLGDCTGFWIGYYFQDRLMKLWPFRRYPHWLAHSEKFIAKHGGKSIIIGRFIGPARSAVPMVAGLLKLTWLRFILAAIPSAALWAIAYMLPGVLLGSLSLEFPPKETATVIGIGLGIIITLWVIFWLGQRFCLYLLAYIDAFMLYCWQRLSQNRRGYTLTQVLADSEDKQAHHQLTRLLLLLTSALLFCILLFCINHGMLTRLNQPLYYLLQSVRTHNADVLFIAATWLGNSLTILISGGLIVILLLLLRYPRTACVTLLLVLTTATSLWLGKHLFFSPRPADFARFDSSSSFPSGHVTLATSLYFFLAWLTAQRLKTPYRWTPYFIACILVSLVSLSRVYLGAHWLTDIIGSWLLGATIVLACALLLKRLTPFCGLITPELKYWLGVIAGAILLPWLIILPSQYPSSLQQYSLHWPQLNTTVSQWWQDPSQYVPFYRLNRLGRPSQAFNIQWAANNLDEISHFLQLSNWLEQTANNSHLKNTVKRFSSYDPEYHSSLFPWLYRGKKPVLTMIKHLKNTPDILELRLWPAGVKFSNSRLRLWVGIVTYHRPPEKLLALPNSKAIMLRSSDKIQNIFDQQNGFKTKLIQVDPIQLGPYATKIDWDGKILLVSHH